MVLLCSVIGRLQNSILIPNQSDEKLKKNPLAAYVFSRFRWFTCSYFFYDWLRLLWFSFKDTTIKKIKLNHSNLQPATVVMWRTQQKIRTAAPRKDNITFQNLYKTNSDPKGKRSHNLNIETMSWLGVYLFFVPVGSVVCSPIGFFCPCRYLYFGSNTMAEICFHWW